MKFFYIPMTYEEAAKELDQAGINAKLLSGETARKILEESLTPTQAQAVLMTAWGRSSRTLGLLFLISERIEYLDLEEEAIFNEAR